MAFTQPQFDPLDSFDQVLIKIKETHDKKRADYSSETDRFSNFKFAAEIADIRTDQVIEALIGVKCARLVELNKPGKIPQNESLEDTLLDRAVYSILAYVFHVQTYTSSQIDRKQ